MSVCESGQGVLLQSNFSCHRSVVQPLIVLCAVQVLLGLPCSYAADVYSFGEPLLSPLLMHVLWCDSCERSLP